MQLGRPGTEDSCLLHDVVDGNGLAQSLERQIADFFELYRVLDGTSGATGNQDLPVLRLGAKPGRQIGDRADRGVVHTLGKADLPQRRIPLRDADAKAEVVTMPPPQAKQGLSPLAHRHRHVNRPLGGVRGRHRVVEEHHDAVAAVMVDRALVLGDDRSTA